MNLRKLLFIAGMLCAAGASAQNDITVKGDTLVLNNGMKYWLGEQVTLGAGSSGDKSFSFIYEPEIPYIKKRKPLDPGYFGQKGTVRKFQRDGAYKNTYSYNILVLEFSNQKKFWCDVKGALANNEILADGNAGGQGGSRDEKLARLKKLYDSGTITKEEYETLKSKIMNDRVNTPSKTGDKGPVVF